MEVGKKDLMFLISASSWQSKSPAALDSLLDVNGIEGMSFFVTDFLHLTKPSMFINSTNIFLLFTYNHARCFYNSVSFVPIMF